MRVQTLSLVSLIALIAPFMIATSSATASDGVTTTTTTSTKSKSIIEVNGTTNTVEVSKNKVDVSLPQADPASAGTHPDGAEPGVSPAKPLNTTSDTARAEVKPDLGAKDALQKDKEVYKAMEAARKADQDLAKKELTAKKAIEKSEMRSSDAAEKRTQMEATVDSAGVITRPEAVIPDGLTPVALSTGVTKSHPRVALALGGGGTRGAAHVGVLKVLTKAGIPIDMVVGTSMGAIVGGLWDAGVPLDELSRRFDDGTLMRTFMTVPLGVRLAISPIMVAPRFFGHHAYDGLYRGKRFRTYVNSIVPIQDQNIESLHLPFAAVVLNLVDGKTYRLTKGNLGQALQASSAVPSLRKPVQIEDQLYVDGGVLSNVPVTHAKEMSADFVIAVNVDEHLDKAPLHQFRGAGSVPKRVVTIQLNFIDSPQCDAADFVIHPNVDKISLISRKGKDGRRAVEAGELAATLALPELRRKLIQAHVLSADGGTAN